MAIDLFSPTTQMAEVVRTGQGSSRDLVDLHLERIERFDPQLNAVVTLDADDARWRADELDRRLARQGPVGLLHGVPLTLKDCWATAGIRTTAGDPEMADCVPDADAEVVARLRSAGAIVMGKTDVPEQVTGQETGNPLFGRTRNPEDPDRTPGGSPGGAAAAVAAGLTPLEVGSDSGGSIREPAHCCDVVGHFSTSALVPLAGHLPSVPVDDIGADQHLMAAGPLARSASDLALAMHVLAGVAPLEEAPAPERLNVAVWLDGPHVQLSRDVASLVAAAGDALGTAGASVREAGPPFDTGRPARWPSSCGWRRRLRPPTTTSTIARSSGRPARLPRTGAWRR
ncbi:MAG TPA: amidase family protein [Acidimicrobiales bacterium]|nr:amidase family protein [Acidimicrobiales bacterium]